MENGFEFVFLGRTCYREFMVYGDLFNNGTELVDLRLIMWKSICND